MMTRPDFVITTVDAISATIIPSPEKPHCRQPPKRKLRGAGRGSPETTSQSTSQNSPISAELHTVLSHEEP